MTQNQPSTDPLLPPLDFKTKLAFGIGELSGEIPGSILVFFVLFFLTEVAGLNPTYAGSVLLVGRIWDAINDPLVGWLSDRTRSPLGRRYPWMLGAAIPLGICFGLQWIVLPTDDQRVMFFYYSAIGFFYYAAFTAVRLPFNTLAAELTQTYDERTGLASFKAAFSIFGSIFGLVLAQLIFAAIAVPEQRFLVLGSICSVAIVVAIAVCVAGTYPRYRLVQAYRDRVERPPSTPMLASLREIFSNRPFLFVIGIYMCSWLSLQLTAVILPYFVVHWMGLSEQHFTQMAIAVQGTAFSTMLFWSWIGRRIGKRAIYCFGVPLTICAQVGLFLLPGDRVTWMYLLGVLAGFGLAPAYLVPWSMLPDVVDLDELNSGQRREGIYYSFIVQLQKVGAAIAIFLVGRLLDVAGFQPTSREAGIAIAQPDSALLAIRTLVGLVPSLFLAIGFLVAWFYPISRAVHAEIVAKLEQRHAGTSLPESEVSNTLD